MSFVENLVLFAAVKVFCNWSRIEKVIAMVRVARFLLKVYKSMLAAPYAHDLWPLDLMVNACHGPAIEYMCTKFSADGSSRFSSTAQTHMLT